MDKMDKNKLQGKIREQMNREIKARREFNAKWSFMSSNEVNKFYDQSHLNSKIDEMAPLEKPLKTKSDCSDVGESYFVSKSMFKAMDVCRCGRKKQGVHLTKCMQKCLVQYSSEQEAFQEETTNEMPNIPRTSTEIHGFFPCKYLELERSTYYKSPKSNLKYKITDSIYNNIIIG